MSDMGEYTSSSFFLLIKLPRPSGSFILLPSLLHRPSQAPPPQNLPVKRAHPPHPLPARPYYTTNRPAQPVYSRGGGREEWGRNPCGRPSGALVVQNHHLDVSPVLPLVMLALWGPVAWASPGTSRW